MSDGMREGHLWLKEASQNRGRGDRKRVWAQVGEGAAEWERSLAWGAEPGGPSRGS